MIRHLTLKVSHEDAASLSTVTPMPPPFSAHIYFCNVTDLNWTSVPSYIWTFVRGSIRLITRYKKTISQKKRKERSEFKKILTSISPLGMPSNSEGLIQPSTTSQPPKFTPLTLEPPLNPSTYSKQNIENNYKISNIL